MSNTRYTVMIDNIPLSLKKKEDKIKLRLKIKQDKIIISINEKHANEEY